MLWMARHVLTDEQWSRLEAALPKHRGRPAERGDRNFLDAVVWMARTGAPWRDLPIWFGPWKTVYNRYLRWSKKGVFGDVFKALQNDVDPDGTMADGSVVRTHQHAAGGKGGSRETPLAVLAEVFQPRSTLSSTLSVSLSTSSSRKGSDTR